eukprot:15437479-Alexandrium_andersonii.AAC.1
MPVAPNLRAFASLMARWLAPESTTHGAGRSSGRNSSASPPSRTRLFNGLRTGPGGWPRLAD